MSPEGTGDAAQQLSTLYRRIAGIDPNAAEQISDKIYYLYQTTNCRKFREKDKESYFKLNANQIGTYCDESINLNN